MLKINIAEGENTHIKANGSLSNILSDLFLPLHSTASTMQWQKQIRKKQNI